MTYCRSVLIRVALQALVNWPQMHSVPLDSAAIAEPASCNRMAQCVESALDHVTLKSTAVESHMTALWTHTSEMAVHATMVVTTASMEPVRHLTLSASFTSVSGTP